MASNQAQHILNELLQSHADSPTQVDTWINNSDHRYIVAVHNDHKGGAKTYLKEMPDGTRQAVQGGPSTKDVLVFEPHSETHVPKAYRFDIQTVQCQDPVCQSSPRTRGRCPKDDHAGVVLGGKAPGLRRKGTEGFITIPDVFDPTLIEVPHMGPDGRKFYTLEHPEDLSEDRDIDAVLARKAKREAQAASAKRAPKPIPTKDQP